MPVGYLVAGSYQGAGTPLPQHQRLADVGQRLRAFDGRACGPGLGSAAGVALLGSAPGVALLGSAPGVALLGSAAGVALLGSAEAAVHVPFAHVDAPLASAGAIRVVHVGVASHRSVD